MDMKLLENESRLLIEVPLKPVQGTRFQPTGFPDLGAATYTLADGTEMLLVESSQSMANRLEEVCWDNAKNDLVETLAGLPYIASTLPDGSRTNTILEAHRMNSPYIVKSKEFEKINQEIGFEKNKPFNTHNLIRTLLKYDINSLIHGIFLEKVGGVVRIPRSLSGFIEAKNITTAPSGGVKFDRVQPETTGQVTPYGKADEGYGNVPFPRDEYTGDITAYFNLDLSQIRGFGLGKDVEELLILLALFKIRKILKDGLRLRTACDLEISGDIKVTRPESFRIPELKDIETEIRSAISKVEGLFSYPRITEVVYSKA
ncbi:MAG: type I-U CRISPR-associated RAMP protein Csb1/Cas7u [Candidatus Thermoplasmatota archaeon]|nr:type I-U CRISPR-associated RAMP protein Csb1/Cas7u [Candidatus Thermoplasmatota archaeon]